MVGVIFHLLILLFPCVKFSCKNVSNVLTFKGTNVSVFAVHPGVVNTELTRNIGESYSGCMESILNSIAPYFFKSAEMGAQTTVFCATEDSIENLTGQYFR